MEASQNYVELWGVAEAEPAYSHENHGARFYKFPLRVDRLSGQSDHPVIVVGDRLLAQTPVAAGEGVRVVGQLRSFNNRSGQGSRLVITVLAQELEKCGGGFFNRILLSGVICKQPTLRRTPLGRSICDVILAVNRHYGRADYLPCIAWGQVASVVYYQASVFYNDRFKSFRLPCCVPVLIVSLAYLVADGCVLKRKLPEHFVK